MVLTTSQVEMGRAIIDPGEAREAIPPVSLSQHGRSISEHLPLWTRNTWFMHIYKLKAGAKSIYMERN